jgi:hypothetical protein
MLLFHPQREDDTSRCGDGRVFEEPQALSVIIATGASYA